MALHELDSDLQTVEATLKHWEMKYPEVARAAVDADVVYELALANAKEAVAKVPEGEKSPTVPILEARAILRCEKELLAKKQTAAELDIAKKLLGIAENALSAVQTRSGLYRIESGLTAYK